MMILDTFGQEKQRKRVIETESTVFLEELC